VTVGQLSRRMHADTRLNGQAESSSYLSGLTSVCCWKNSDAPAGFWRRIAVEGRQAYKRDVLYVFFSFSYSRHVTICLRLAQSNERPTMYQSTPISPHANESIARTLAHAVECSGKARHQIASDVGMHRETLLRVLRGERPIALDEAARILTACGAFPARPSYFHWLGRRTSRASGCAARWARSSRNSSAPCRLSSSAPSAEGLRT